MRRDLEVDGGAGRLVVLGGGAATPQGDAVTRMKLFKLAWDMVGTEFAGRHLQYEKFYAGASFIIRNHSYRETDWAEFNTLVEDLMASYDYTTAAAGRQNSDGRFSVAGS